MGYRIKRIQDFANGVRQSKLLLERERWPRERLERFQLRRLEELGQYAAARSPFWRERLPGGRLKLEGVPPLSKAELMDRFDDLVTDRRLRRDDLLEHLAQAEDDALHLDEYRVMASSGSSGSKALFVYDRAAWSGILAMFFRRSDWTGARPRVPRLRLAALGGAAPTHMSRRCACSLDIGVHRLLTLAVTQPLPELVARLNDFQPHHLNAYPSAAALLANEQEAGRLSIAPEALFTNSEPLTPELRGRLERIFAVRPYDFYATTEGLYGHDCPSGSMHLFDDMCIVENVDEEGRSVPAGETGARLLVTNLFNRTQPLIRFEVSDLVSVDPEPCRCGRSLMRLRSLEGRAEEILQIGGTAVHPLEFAVITSDPGVREFQVVQRGQTLLLRLALREDAEDAPARIRARVTSRLEELGVLRPSVEVDTVEEIERSTGGKLQIIFPDPSSKQATTAGVGH